MREFTKSLDEIVETFERNIILQTLKDALGNQSKAAAQLGISKRKMNYKIAKHQIDSKSIKEEYGAVKPILESWHHYSILVGLEEQERDVQQEMPALSRHFKK